MRMRAIFYAVNNCQNLLAFRLVPLCAQMTDKEYAAKFMLWIFRYVAWIGAFLVLSQVLGPAVSSARFQCDTKGDAQFVSRVRLAASATSTRGIGELSCAYHFRVGDQQHYLIQDCALVPGFQPEAGRVYPVVFYQQEPPLIVSQVAFAPGWVRLFTVLMGVLMVVLPRVLLPRTKNFPK